MIDEDHIGDLFTCSEPVGCWLCIASALLFTIACVAGAAAKMGWL